MGIRNKSSNKLYSEVEDTGVGIASHEIKKVFEIFTQTDSGKKSKNGTGLGVPISQKFVRMLGGDLQDKVILVNFFFNEQRNGCTAFALLIPDDLCFPNNTCLSQSIELVFI